MQICWHLQIDSIKALVRRAILTSNIAIKRQKDIFPAIFFFSVWIENIARGTIKYKCMRFEKILKCNSNILTKKYCFIAYLFIVISFYRNIACKNCSSDENLTVIQLGGEYCTRAPSFLIKWNRLIIRLKSYCRQITTLC